MSIQAGPPESEQERSACLLLVFSLTEGDFRPMNEGHKNLSQPLSKLSSQIDAVTEKAVALTKRLNAEQLRQRPGPNAWSVAECIRHLNITSEEYLPILDEALKRARHQQVPQKANLKMDVMGRLLKWSLEPPTRFKVKTTAQFEPSDTQSTEDLLPSFAALQQELKMRIESERPCYR
jgi:uncharacterized damage-inducible protein DinB